MYQFTDLGKLNSATKYPSIPTYHPMEKGKLQMAIPVSFEGAIHVQEKVDGTNARIILFPTDEDWQLWVSGTEGRAGGPYAIWGENYTRYYLLGSREDLLYGRGDVIGNPAMGIVDGLRPIAERLSETVHAPQGILVIYGEFYGHSIGGSAKQYTREGRQGFRIFDVQQLGTYRSVLAQPREQIARWRDEGNQTWWSVKAVEDFAAEHGLQTVPYVDTLHADTDLPLTIEAMHGYLEKHATTHCHLDTGVGVAEGIILRNEGRLRIAKARLEDYDRWARQQRP